MKIDENTVTTDDIKDALRKRYCQPEFQLMFEVEGDNERRADAIAMNMWPSRGNYIAGFEIKISKSDLKRELKDGGKAESTSKYCHYWLLVVPKGLIDNTILIPEPWGILEYTNRGLRMKKRPVIKKPVFSYAWVASMLRATKYFEWNSVHKYEIKLRKDIEETNEKKIQYEVNKRARSVTKDFVTFRKACDIAGFDFNTCLLEKDSINKLAFRLSLIQRVDDVLSGVLGLNRLKQSLLNQVDIINELQEAFNQNDGVGKSMVNMIVNSCNDTFITNQNKKLGE